MTALSIPTEQILSVIRNENDKLKPSIHSGIFLLKNGNQWLLDASLKPPPKPLFLRVWYEGEVCILFADTNLGKSILAVMILNQIAQTQKGVYIDFELSDKQFEARYSNNFTNHYCFPDNFYRAEINPDEADFKGAGFNTLEEYITNSIKGIMLSTGAKVLIIDNLTYLRSETEKAKEALPLMKELKALKNELSLSILVLAHTPKRNLALPITRNDLQGSKMLINFCDSAFAIGESVKDKNLRYLKQIKSRNSEIEYDSENVAVYEITKPDNYLAFTHVHTSSEREHLKQYTSEDRDKQKELVLQLHSQGKSQREISIEVGVAVGTVNKYINCSRS